MLILPRVVSFFLANNPLCYSANYGTWATKADYLPSMQLCPGCDFCQNGGLCQAGPVSYSCICPTGFTGQNCGTQSSCSPGTALSSGVCHLCSAGTFSTDGESCVRCQLGTSSNATAATESCSPCSSGTYAPSTKAISCTSCPSCSQMGSFAECVLSKFREGQPDQCAQRPDRRNSNTCFWLDLCRGSCWLYAPFNFHPFAFASPNTSLCFRSRCDHENSL